MAEVLVQSFGKPSAGFSKFHDFDRFFLKQMAIRERGMEVVPL